jgi:hypothetical protein
MHEEPVMAIALFIWVVACCKGFGIRSGMRSLSKLVVETFPPKSSAPF